MLLMGKGGVGWPRPLGCRRRRCRNAFLMLLIGGARSRGTGFWGGCRGNDFNKCLILYILYLLN